MTGPNSPDSPPDVVPQLLSTAKTAKLLDCNIRTIYRLMDRSELTPIKLGRVLRFELADIQRYIDRNRR